MFVVSASISVSKVPCVAHCTLAGNTPCVRTGINASGDLLGRKYLLNMGYHLF